MLAARLHGPRDLRLERVPHPGPPGPGEALVRVTATGVCGSDLHTYLDGRIGDTVLEAPRILGHEFAGIIEQSGDPQLHPGTRVAVDPALPCRHCDLCEQGHPNLCRRLHFCGVSPDNGSLAEFIRMPVRTCVPVPETFDAEHALMLEPLGVAIHATDLAKVRLGDRVAIFGAGPIGLLLLQTVKLAGASVVYMTDPLAYRLKLAEKLGATPLPAGVEVDIAIEAAWGGDAIGQAVELVRLGGRVVLVGIPADDECRFRHSTARRKGLSLVLVRRMKHTYPRAIRLVQDGRVDVKRLITHRYRFADAAEAFELAAGYKDRVVKAVISQAA